MYVTGGIGSRYEGEAFGEDYELPHARAYTETCAAIASVMWNWRMLASPATPATPTSGVDAVQRRAPRPVARAATRTSTRTRSSTTAATGAEPWFGVACCPPNVARMLASLPGYLYTVADDELWVHLYAAGSVDTTLPSGRASALEQRGAYPWDGTVALRVGARVRYALPPHPAWCGEGATLTVAEARRRRRARARRLRARRTRPGDLGDVVELHLPMPVRYLEAHRHVLEATGRAALARGPILYCVEGADHPGLDPRDLVLPADPGAFRIEPSDLPGALPALRAEGTCLPPDEGPLYRTLEVAPGGARAAASDRAPFALTAIPYFAWANRAPGPMQVWTRLPTAPERTSPSGSAPDSNATR
jgi:uncharacterized protein